MNSFSSGWRSHLRRIVLALLVASAGHRAVAAAEPGTNVSSLGMVASVHPLATRAGVDALRDGGNAMDAAVACALVLGVVDGHNSGIGGGCFITLRLANGSFRAIDGREVAPAKASRDLYVTNGAVEARRSLDGARAVAVPGALAAYAMLAEKFGRLGWGRHLEVAARVAENGFSMDRSYAGRLRELGRELGGDPAAMPPSWVMEDTAEFRRIFLPEPGKPPGPGTWFRQPELAASLRTVAREGLGWFYGGGYAERLERWMAGRGGLITAVDLREYSPKVRSPIRTRYRDCEIVGFPPPSSGGVHVAQILGMLEGFDLKAMGAASADWVHVVTEAMKLAFADRARWLGDPDQVVVPSGLVSPDYLRKLASGIRMDRATPVSGAGSPQAFGGEPLGKHTTHLSVADRAGNWVALTTTLNTSFGAKVIVPGTGIVLNNQMDDFSSRPGVPNTFGLVGAEANAIAPGKRPLSSMSPTLVLRDGRPVLSVGAAGGPTIISQTVLAILHVVDFGLDPVSALSQPRFHHQWKPDRLTIEEGYGSEVVRELEKRGHRVKVERLGAAQAVGWDAEASVFRGAADPRGEGVAEGP